MDSLAEQIHSLLEMTEDDAREKLYKMVDTRANFSRMIEKKVAAMSDALDVVAKEIKKSEKFGGAPKGASAVGQLMEQNFMHEFRSFVDLVKRMDKQLEQLGKAAK